MPYIPNTDDERREMLEAIGVSSVDELWERAMVLETPPDLSRIGAGRSEFEVSRYLGSLARLNASDLICFVGGGFYDHLIPSAISHIVERGEFLSSYTPYQAEASQGTLQAIFEYQSIICRITGMEVSNASLYDGGTALFEAILMALRKQGRKSILVAGSLSPIYRKMLECYSANLNVRIVVSPADEPLAVEKFLLSEIPRTGEDLAGVVIQYPDFFGGIHDWSILVEAARKHGAVTICSAYPVALSVLKTPGAMGFDIVTGEGQSLGNPLSFGGPYLGFIGARKEFLRSMPGRIAGRTVDDQGREGFVLTLQAREQHIRREKATSNICTNEALLALRAAIYLSLLGKKGFWDVGQLCTDKANYARDLLLEIPGVEAAGGEAFFNEFLIRVPMDAGILVGRMIQKGFAAGFPLGRYFPDRHDQLLVAVTEKRTKEEIKGLAIAMESVLCG